MQITSCYDICSNFNGDHMIQLETEFNVIFNDKHDDEVNGPALYNTLKCH